MPYPFSPEYAPTPATQVQAPQVVPIAPAAATSPQVTVATAQQTPAAEFKTTAYGTGKPKRVIIRGKVTSD